jgi:dihydroorotate dehydrogenase electron transfer subunit
MNEQILNQTVTVYEQIQLGKNYFRLEFFASECCVRMKPGQFLNIRLKSLHDPLLRRPMSIHSIDKKTGRFSVLYQVVGRGTELLNHLVQGDVVEILAPLGKEFPLPVDSDPKSHPVALIAGGIGIAPLLALTKELCELGHPCSLYFGARTSADFEVLTSFTDLGANVFTATEDGSCGNCGYITKGLKENIKRMQAKTIYACGPMPMLKALKQELQSVEIPLWLSLEAHMACGLGACLGCTVKVKNPTGGWRYALICQEGPVIAASEVIFDE